MPAHRHLYRRCWIAIAGAALLLPSAHAQPAPSAPSVPSVPSVPSAKFYPILEITQNPLSLYKEPKISAPSTAVAVPEGHKGKLGDAWRVLSATPQFYEIQAGEHGHGFARRNAISILPGSGILAYCGSTASLPNEPTATIAGMGARC